MICCLHQYHSESGMAVEKRDLGRNWSWVPELEEILEVRD